MKSRSSLLVHRVPLDNLSYGDVDNKIELTLPDVMQSSTMVNIVPPSSFQNLQASVSNHQAVAEDTNDEVSGQGTGSS